MSEVSDKAGSRRTLRPFRPTAPNKVGRWILGAALAVGAILAARVVPRLADRHAS
jgi:hypothetical protein